MTTVDERHEDGMRDEDDRDAHHGVGDVVRVGAEAVPLRDPRAARIAFAGSKAAHLARAAGAGLPVLPGFVVPTIVPRGEVAARESEGLRRAWQELSADGTRPLVVRSSSPREDTEESSLAGQFASVLDVRGWHGFRAAVRTVLDSAHRPDGTVAPMAVLVQPMLAARVGGVLFGADPLEGRTDRMLVSAVRGGPDALVSGQQPGTGYWLGRCGRVSRTGPEDAEPLLGAAELRRLARLARQARALFGGPQDIEFGFDEAGRLWLFQSRPITAMAARPARGARLLGPGPVAETFPDQLEPLEEDLWVAPMARGLAAALDIGGTASRRRLRAVPVVTTVGGRAAADLRLLGAAPPRHRWLTLLDPTPGARRLAAAWRVGRLASALPGLATDLVADVDRRLAGTPPPDRLDRRELVAALRWTRTVLVSLHAQEALAGALLAKTGTTAAGAALAALAQARALGVPDRRLVAAQPVVLALTPPALSRELRLPESPADTAGLAAAGGPARTPGRGAAGNPGDRKGPTAAGNPAAPDGHADAGNPTDTNGRAAAGSHADTNSPATAGHTAAPDGHTATGNPTDTNGQAAAGSHADTDGPAAARDPAGPDGRADAAGNPASTNGHSAAGIYASPDGHPAAGSYATPDGHPAARSYAEDGRTPERSTGTSPLRARPAAVGLAPREALRLRVRWVQELQVRLVRDAARRLSVPVAPGDVPDAPRAPGSSRVGLLRWPELIRALEHGALPADFAERLPRAASAPLPDTFRLAAGGAIVAERPRRGSGGDRGGNEGQGVSGGRAVGTAWDGTGPRPPDPVLVVRTLDPALAPVLPGLAGLVAQTGSPLSHLAVLAREFGLPTVVGVTDAVRRFPPGSRLTIDGTTGDVHTDDPRTAPPPSPVRPPTATPAPTPAPIPAPTSALAPAPASASAPVPGQVRRGPR